MWTLGDGHTLGSRIMRRHILNLLLIVTLVLQGIVAVGADALHDEAQEQHCVGDDAQSEDCACCADGQALGAACTVQCSVSQAAIAMIMPARIATHGTVSWFLERSIQDPSYTPLVPPPIR